MNNKKKDRSILAASLDNRLFFRLYQSANMMHKTGTRALEQSHITTQQWAIIGALSRRESSNGIAVSELAAFLMVSRQNLTGLLSRLESRNLIERTVSTVDSRRRLIRLTEAGRRLWRTDMRQNIGTYYDTALEGFSTTDKIHVIHYLDKLLENLSALDPEDKS